jgi:hypothetical protein
VATRAESATFVIGAPLAALGKAFIADVITPIII